jgi:membrane fusion protein, multidrug efflux system
MKKQVKWALSGLLVVGVIGAATAFMAGKNNAPKSATKKEAPPLEFAQSDLVALQSRRLAAELAMPGNVQAVSQATVRAKVSAEVRRVLVREGDRVAAGQVIAEFDTAQLRAQLAERTATHEAARAQLAMTERTREANAALVKQNFISQNAFDTADKAHQAQTAAVAAARAQLDQIQLMMSDTTVRAPIAGTVAKRHVQPGEKVSFDAPLLAIVDLSQLEVQAQAPVADVPQIATGMTARVEVEGLPQRPYPGRVERINPSTEPGTRTINVYVSLANEGALLKAGMFARVVLAIGADAESPALPLSAIRNEGGADFVWALADGRLVRREVVLGRRDERAQWVEVKSGVTPADRVIATKFDNLRDGLAATVIGGLGTARVAEQDAPRAPRTN